MTTNTSTDGIVKIHTETTATIGDVTVTRMRAEDTGRIEWHIVLETGDEPLTLSQARRLAGALLEAADGLDGKQSTVLIEPAI